MTAASRLYHENHAHNGPVQTRATVVVLMYLYDVHKRATVQRHLSALIRVMNT